MIKGYFSNLGYFGWIGDRYMLFASESDYLSYISEKGEDYE